MVTITVEAFPSVIQGRTYTAEIIRRMFGTLLKRGATVGSIVGGLAHEGDCAISYTGTELKVQVATGECWVPGSSNATQSGYYFRVSAAETLTPAAVSGTVRVDAIVARVKDKAYTGTEDIGVLEVVKGTPKAGATLANLEGAPGHGGGPALPESVLVLGYALIPASGTAVTVSSTAEVAQPGLQRYEEGTAAARPTFGVKGRTYYATDTESYSLDTGTAWHSLFSLGASSKYVTKSVTVAELEAGVEFSATRAALLADANHGLGGMKIGGVSVGGPTAGLNRGEENPRGLIVPPGEKLVGGMISTPTTITYLLL